MYAYENGNGVWRTNPVTESVFNTYTNSMDSLISGQRVGLAFDANNYPVISFVAGGSTDGNSIYLAYDPTVVPEPSTLALLAAGGALLLSAAGRLRRRRLAGKQ